MSRKSALGLVFATLFAGCGLPAGDAAGPGTVGTATQAIALPQQQTNTLQHCCFYKPTRSGCELGCAFLHPKGEKHYQDCVDQCVAAPGEFICDDTIQFFDNGDQGGCH